jgi:fructoselysine-6-P-deglycase FrlB-like protein
MNSAEIQTFIREQPAVLRRVLDEIPPAVGKIPGFLNSDRIHLVGSGTSRNALLAVGPLFEKTAAGRVQVRSPLAFMEEVKESEKESSVAIILSQTGTSTSSIEAVEHSRRLGMRTITLTAEVKSPIVAVSSEILVFPAGPEPVGPKTKGYSASVLTLLLMATGAERINLRVFPFLASYSALIEQSSQVMMTLAESSREADHFLVMGQGRHFATAQEGSLKITEMSGIPAAAFEIEEAFHGRFHGLSGRGKAIFVVASPEQHRMAVGGAGVLSELGVGTAIFNLSGCPPSPFDLSLPWPLPDSLPELDLLSAIVPFQFLGWHLARGKGVVPENMRYPGLSQRLRIKTRAGA